MNSINPVYQYTIYFTPNEKFSYEDIIKTLQDEFAKYEGLNLVIMSGNPSLIIQTDKDYQELMEVINQIPKKWDAMKINPFLSSRTFNVD